MPQQVWALATTAKHRSREKREEPTAMLVVVDTNVGWKCMIDKRTVSIDDPKAIPSSVPPPLVVNRFSKGSRISPFNIVVPMSAVPFHCSTISSPRKTISSFLGALLASSTNRVWCFFHSLSGFCSGMDGSGQVHFWCWPWRRSLCGIRTKKDGK